MIFCQVGAIVFVANPYDNLFLFRMWRGELTEICGVKINVVHLFSLHQKLIYYETMRRRVASTLKLLNVLKLSNSFQMLITCIVRGL